MITGDLPVTFGALSGPFVPSHHDRNTDLTGRR
jgi:hypothetical protein